MRKTFSVLVLAVLLACAVPAATRAQYTLLTGASTTVDGTATQIVSTQPISYQVAFRDIGARTVSATVLVQGSNDNTNWETLVTFTLSNTTTHDGASFHATWRYVRASITAISLGSGGATPTITVTASTVAE